LITQRNGLTSYPWLNGGTTPLFTDHSNTSPFQTSFGYPPSQLPLGHPPHSAIEYIDTFLRNRHHTFTQLCSHLLHAQERMKKFADLKRIER
jgi:hypothetical protein